MGAKKSWTVIGGIIVALILAIGMYRLIFKKTEEKGVPEDPEQRAEYYRKEKEKLEEHIAHAPPTVIIQSRPTRVWSDMKIVAPANSWGTSFSVAPSREAIEKLGPGTIAFDLITDDPEATFKFSPDGGNTQYDSSEGNVGTFTSGRVWGEGKEVNVRMYWYVH